MLKIKSITNISDLRALREAWNNLLEESPARCIFNRWEWHYTWWEVYGAGKRLRTLTAWDGDRLLGVAPFFLETTRCLGAIPAARLRFTGTGAVAPEHLDIIARAGREEEVVTALFRMAAELWNWDFMFLEDLRSGSTTTDALRQACRHSRYLLEVNPGQVCPFIRLPQTWEEYLGSRSKRNRKRIRHDRRVLLEKMGATVVEAHDLEALRDGLSSLILLHQSRWTSRGKLGSFGTDRFRNFHNRIIERLHTERLVRLHTLFHHSKTIAVYYSFVLGRKYYCYSTGFDPTKAKYGPGTVLLSEVLSQAIEEGLDEFDFLRGEMSYKEHWANNRRTLKHVLITRTPWKGELTKLERRGKTLFAAQGKALLPERSYLFLQRIRDYLKLS